MTPEEAALVRQSAAILGAHVDDGSLARIDRFLELLAVWNRRVRLTGERDRHTILVRHVADSLAAVRWLPVAGLVIDVGSGAGFPGIILGCVRPDLSLTLIESRRRRTSFLGEAIRSIPLPRARVVCTRAEQAADDGDLAHTGGVVIARALRLDVFLALAASLVAPRGVAIAMQTPGSRGTAAKTAATSGFRLSGAHEYLLPDARKRTIMLFTAS